VEKNEDCQPENTAKTSASALNSVVIRTFYKHYILRKDTPSTRAGAEIKWDLWREIYTSKRQVSGIDKTEETFTISQVEGQPEWFKPTGDEFPFYEKFPDDFEKHFDFGELRHNKMCRFCSVAESIYDSEEFKLEVTAVFKRLYEARIKAV
jgi:tRNA U34 5-methylaminomethyl-2-thiouridine-forming methyltransferase MnmC